MNNLKVFEELSLSCPEGFQEMSSRELDQAFGERAAKRFGLWNKEMHIMLLIQCRRVNVLLAALADPKSTLRGTELRLRRALKEMDYQKGKALLRPIAGRQVPGFSFEYRSGGLEQTGEVYLLKEKRCYYTIYLYAQKPLTGERRRLAEDLLESIRL